MWPTNKPENPSIGDTFYDESTRTLMLFLDSRWLPLMPAPPDEITELCETHPGLAELKRNLDEAQERFNVYLALVRKN